MKDWRKQIAELNTQATDNYSRSSLDFVYSNISIQNGKPVIDFQYYGKIKNSRSVTGQMITDFWKSYGFELQSSFYEQKVLEASKKECEDYRFSACYVSEKGYVKVERRVSYREEDGLYFDITAEKDFFFEEDFAEKFIDKFAVRRETPKEEFQKEVYTLMATAAGYKIGQLGRIGRKFIPDNYPPDIRESFNKLVENIRAENPFGRLSILTGAPGTGKTFFIKGLIEEFKKVKFIMVDPGIMTNISGPNLISTFLEEANPDYPIVLCIEDADSCLVGRMQDNMSYISSLLNLTDGIYGESLNIHVIASTNQKKVEIDPALARPGRMHQMIEFRKLNKEEAENIYKRETGQETSFEAKDSEVTLKKDKTGFKTGFKSGAQALAASPITEDAQFTIAEVYNKIYSGGQKKEISKTLKEEVEGWKVKDLIF